MNTSFIRIVVVFCVAMLFILNVNNSLAGNYTWTGSANKNWNNSANWSPSGTPSTNDTVTIGGGSDTLLIAANTTINRLVISGRVVNLGGYQLEISQYASLNGGEIYNGTLILRGALANFAGIHTYCQIDCIVGQLQFNGGVFDGESSFEQNGTTSGYGSGGCVFNAPTIIKKSTNAILRLGESLPDTFNSRVEFICENKVPLEISYGSASVFNDLVSLSCHGANSEIIIGNDSDSVQFSGDAALITGSEGLNDGMVLLKRISQSSRIDNELTGAEGFVINIESSTFNAGMILTAPSILLKNSVFLGDVALTKTQAASNNYSYGGNSFYGKVTLLNEDGTNALRFANNIGDHFYNDVIFPEGSRRIQMAYAGNSQFEGNVSINSNDVKFNSGSGKVVLSGEKNQTLDGTSQFLICKLELDKSGGMLQLNQQMTIDSSITFINGIINTDSTITLKAAVNCSGASNLSFVDGPVKKIGNTAFVFPVGDEGKIGSIEISAPAASTESFTARYFARPAQQVSDSVDTTLSKVSLCNYWSLNRNSGTTNVKVKLYWDTIGCALFDTSSIRVAEFNGSNWRSLGKMNVNGNVDMGSFQNFDNVSSYSFFTFGIIVTTLDVTADISQSVNRPIQEDFFGFNGANTIELDVNNNSIQSWEDLFSDGFAGNTNPKTLAFSPVNVMRYPAGTLSNYSDWRSGWFIREKHLPNNWLYDKSNYRKEPDYLGNELSNFRDNLNLIAARPMLAWNILTSKLNYEIASTYRLGEINLPLKYIEIGNEFYLNDEHYKEEFPSVLDYYKKVKDWLKGYRDRNIPESNNVKFAVVGADYGPNTQGRRKLWLETLLQEIDPSDKIAAVTIHDYIETGLNVFNGSCLATGPTYLATYLNKAFKDGETLRLNAFSLVQQANQGHLSTFPLEIWMTEFNNLDFENAYIGTWPHGLFNAAMALQYLETPAVGKVITHTMISDAVFGNIFESDHAFDNIKCHGALNSTTTRKGEFTALGNALNQIAIAMKNATDAKKIVFTPTSTGSIPTIISSSNYPVLYGWYFENIPGEKQLIILNLDFDNSNVYNLDISSLNLGTNLHYDQITCSDFQNAILGSALTLPFPSPLPTNELFLSSFPVSGNITLQAGSITRIYQETTPLQLKLTDDVICVGSSTSLAISGGEGAISVPVVSGLTISNLPLGNSATSDHYWGITANAAGPYTITVTDGNGITATIGLTVHDNIDNLVISANVGTAPISYCPGASPIELEATYTPGSGSGPDNSLVNDYHIIWAPDTGITSNLCSGSDLPVCHTIYVSPERTTTYSVYVTDENCWSSASVIVEVPISSVILGPDFNACTGTNNPIVLNPLVESESGSLSYSWSTGATTSSITLNSLVANANIYTVTVTDLNGCSVEESVQINGTNCCTGISNSITALPVTFDNPETGLNEYYIFGDQLYTAVNNACSSCVDWIPQNSALIDNNTRLDIDLSSTSPPLSIIINQTIVIRNDILDAGGAVLLDGYNLTIKNANILFGPEAKIVVRQGRKLTLENCTLNVCGSEIWKGIEVEPIADDGEPHIIFKNCVIMNAEQSILLGKNAQFEIENCTFTDNYIDIFIEKYSKKNLDQKFDPEGNPNGMATQNFIRSNTFTSSGNTLLAPYNNVHKFAAIVLDDVERVVIGDSSLDASVDANEFSNSNCGIRAFNSSFELYNNYFSNITELDGEILEVDSKGACVSSISRSDFNDRYCIIGNKDYNLSAPSQSHRNKFHSSVFGIVSRGEMNMKVFNNEFGNSASASDALTYCSIATYNSANKKIYISRGNAFYDYNVGIKAFSIGTTGSYHIVDNNFVNATSSIPSNPTSFQGTAIWAANPMRPASIPNESYLQIINNRIGVPNNSQGRIGIFTSSITIPQIQDNKIYFQVSGAPASPTLGIWVQNSYDPKIINNEIINTSNLTHGNALTGIRSDMNTLGCFSLNTIQNMGYSFHFMGNHGQIGFAENEMNYYDHAIFLNNADIGVQGSPTVGAIRTDNNEFIHDPLGLQPDRVIGSTSSGTPISWYYDGSNDQLYNPDINVNLPTNLLFAIGLTPSLGQTPLQCPVIIDPIARNLAYGYIVRDTARYDESNARIFNHHSRQRLYEILKFNPSLMEMNDSTDTYYESFYDVAQVSNLAKFDSVRQYLESGNYSSALALVNAITDTNSIEELCKYVYGIGINILPTDSMLSNSDSANFYEIGSLHALTTGDAAFITRNNLFYEVHDGELGSGTRIAQISNQRQKSFFVEVYPVPANDNIYFIYKNRLPEAIEVFDILQRCVLKSGSVNEINLNLLSPGSYIISFLENKKVLATKKIIKLQ